jgi:hypothetical protein
MSTSTISAGNTARKYHPLGIVVAALGVVVAIVPTLIYQTYEAMPDMTMQCLATAHAEIATGAGLAVVGILYFLAKRPQTRLILSVLVAAIAALALLFPTNWTGLCESARMACHMITLPVLIVSVVVLWVLAAAGILTSLRKLKQANAEGAQE